MSHLRRVLPDVEDAARQEVDVLDVQPQEPDEADGPGEEAVEGGADGCEEAVVAGTGVTDEQVAVERDEDDAEEGDEGQAVGGVAKDRAQLLR